MADVYALVCPIRGELPTTGRSRDGLTRNEEYYRVEAIKHLLKNGYPKDNFRIEVVEKRFGNNGRNSFRCDFVVLDMPETEVSHDVDDVLKHAVLLCEVKRDKTKKEWVEKTQVEPMLDFAKRLDAIALFWAGTEQRLFWQEDVDGVRETREAPLASLPIFGAAIERNPLTFATIEPCESLLDAFSHIDDILHQASITREKRYEILFQLLLAKIFDEHQFETRPDEPLDLQDFEYLGVSPEHAKKRISETVSRAVTFYQQHLPNRVAKKIDVPADTLCRVMKTLAPLQIITSKRDVVQTFYMKFAKDIYRWDMAQYFTPTMISDFVVDVLNPQFGEHSCDPACGSADFLVGTFRYGKKYNPGFADCIWGFDNDDSAVQVAVLNMILNGDGKTNIKKADSLLQLSSHEDKFDILVCNPPFGSNIVESRKKVLASFDLGHDWSISNGEMVRGDILEKQETGILFVEACVRMCHEGGRIAIILPNGYLGNKSSKFQIMREWLLRRVRIAAVVSLPRFAFKESGADVSASILFMSKRECLLSTIEEIDSYPISYQLIQKLGWNAGEKKKKVTYVRDQKDGALLLDEDGNPIVDRDYEDVLTDILNSDAAEFFPWLLKGRSGRRGNGSGWSINSRYLINSPERSLDPKFYCRKNQEHLTRLLNVKHAVLGELVDFIPEKKRPDGTRVTIDKSRTYYYADISHITNGYYSAQQMKGWQLPDRAKHFAEGGDFFFGSIWGSVSKWCLIPDGANDVVITNGCFRCHMKPGKEKYLTDILAYATSESWASQARARSRGSDGLAEVPLDDAKAIIVPLLSDEARERLYPDVEKLLVGRSTLAGEVNGLIQDGAIQDIPIEHRPSHINLV